MKHNLEIFFRLCLAICFYIATLHPMHARESKPDYGIRIQTAPTTTTEYTAILIDDGNPIPTHKEDIRIDLDLWAYKDNPLGSICKVLADNGSSIDLMYCVGADYISYPMLVTGDKDIVQTTPLKYKQWVHVSLTMSPETGEIEMDYNGEVSRTTYPAFVDAQSISIALGFCKLTDYPLFDVASVAIKDIKIKRGDDNIRHWKMERHDADTCYDEIDNAIASAENPKWLIDENASWENIFTAEFPYYPSVAFDSRVSTFYLSYKNGRTLYVFHANEDATDTIQVKGGEYPAVYPNQLMYLAQRRQLLAYNLDEDIYSSFDPVDQKWDSDKKCTKEHAFWNNSTIYNPVDSAIVSFGGYGFYHYNNKLLRNYPYSDKAQTSKTIKEIHPRYSCSSVLVDSIMYVFGGRGCKSGRQELGPRNYYDMYAINLHTDSVTKLWGNNESPMGRGNDFVPGENMVYDKESNSMYIFATYHGGILFRADMTTGAFEQMSLPIHASLQAQTLYYNLYYSSTQKSFYAVMVNSDVNGVSELNIYQLDYPPVPVTALSQSIAPKSASNSDNLLVIISVCILGALITASGVFFLRRRSNQPQTTVTEPTPASLNDNTPTTPLAEVAIPAEPETTTPFYDLEKSSVRLLGGFRVFDSKGDDITHVFTPTLKSLLILLILHTGKNPMGIPNSKILTLLWGDKEEDAAKNNRNVYMSRLRNILSQIGDVTIQSHNGFRNINFGSGTTCDYLEAMRLFEDSSNENLDRLLELLFNGMILPNVEVDYVDSFKSSFSDRTLDLLISLIHQPNLSNRLKLKIADTLFQHDYINEDALFAKCRILHLQGRTGLAQTAYNSFCKEYKSIIGSDYPHTLTDILNTSNEN